MRFSIWPKREKKPRQHIEFFIHVLCNWYGFSFQWDCYAPVESVMGVYAIKFYWGNCQPSTWWSFAWQDYDDTGSLKYSRGHHGRQVAGWTLRGPLVKFVQSQF